MLLIPNGAEITLVKERENAAAIKYVYQAINQGISKKQRTEADVVEDKYDVRETLGT